MDACIERGILISKGKAIPVIAEELEEDTHIIEQIVASIASCRKR